MGGVKSSSEQVARRDLDKLKKKLLRMIDRVLAPSFMGSVINLKNQK